MRFFLKLKLSDFHEVLHDSRLNTNWNLRLEIKFLLMMIIVIGTNCECKILWEGFDKCPAILSSKWSSSLFCLNFFVSFSLFFSKRVINVGGGPPSQAPIPNVQTGDTRIRVTRGHCDETSVVSIRHWHIEQSNLLIVLLDAQCKAEVLLMRLLEMP